MKKRVRQEKIHVCLYNEEDREEYINFIANHAYSHVFHTVEWKEFIEHYFHFKPYYILARNREDEICGVLPLFYIDNYLGKRLESLPLSMYGGFLGDPQSAIPVLKEAMTMMKELQCYLHIKQWPRGGDLGGSFEEMGLHRAERRINQLLAIQNPDLMWNSLTSSNRRAIRKAEKNNVIVEKYRTMNDIEDVYTIELETRRRIGMTPHPMQYYLNMIQSLSPTEHIEMFLAKKDGNTLASTIILNHKQSINYFLSASNQEGRRIGANNLLVWNILQWGYDNEYKEFNFGGTPLDAAGKIASNFKGLYFFKNSFKTDNIPLSWYYYPNTIDYLDHLTKTHPSIQMARVLLRRCPLFLLKKTKLMFSKKFV